MIVTIDGVAASGKSSVSSGVARALGVPYVSSGLLYRAATLLGLEAGLELQNAPGLLAYLQIHPLRLEPLAGGNRIWQGERELTGELHSTRVDAGVSVVAALPEVRAWVDAQLRALPSPFVAEGRDMGTNVFPHAGAKFYLTASPHVRAQRRAQERPEDVPAIEAALIRRDALDRVQSAPAPDAVVIDTGPLTLDGVIQTILAQLPEQQRSRPASSV
ncbi:(d)CMP kinase [Deinococcus humi]|uniref:Cytidylate kinase n=1 Tax=Deinococcus humi TaxID=662880 RepID=A0A7W8JQV0_9DEIO|nr:(d)CMP kinase [Deinococcus humi]MBB5361542.1 cytidylate kinase [Deinococcus humi]GGO20624.1 cytidylate kinase [Deinococcus humi]